MLILLTYHAISHLIHHCDHDDLFRNQSFYFSKPEGVRKTKDVKKKEPIRIYLNMDQLNSNYNDEFKCTTDKIGQTIKWGSYTTTCKEEGVLTEEKINAIIGTMNNVKSYLEKTLKVERLSYQFDLNQNNYGKVPNGKSPQDIDLYLMVYPRMYPDGYSTLASAGSNLLDTTTKRPIQGYVMLNVLESPTTILGEDTQDQYAFMTYIHEIFHSLGISGYYIDMWHPQGSYTPHENPKCQITVGGMKRTIITTPYSHLFAVSQYGEEEFKGEIDGEVCPSGIFLEDRGGSGTAGSHPEWRLYYTDLMVGVTVNDANFPFEGMTPVSMALLWDTGFYEVDYRKGRPLWWGHKETNKGSFIKDFNTGAPQKVFPVDYLFYKVDGKNYLRPGFDYTYLASSGGSYQFDSVAQQHLDWYNPLSRDPGHQVSDYQQLPYPVSQCPEGTGAVGFAGGANCFKYTCLADLKMLQFTYNDTKGYHTLNCTKEDEVIKYKEYIEGGYYYNRELKCPDQENFCRRVATRGKKLTKDPFKEINNPGEIDPPEDTPAGETPSGDTPINPPDPGDTPVETNEELSGNPSGDSGVEDDQTSEETSASEKDNLQKFIDFATEGWHLYVSIVLIVVIVLLIVLSIYCCCCRKKKKDRSSSSSSDDESLRV